MHVHICFACSNDESLAGMNEDRGEVVATTDPSGQATETPGGIYILSTCREAM